MSRLLARLLALVCLIGLSPIARAAAAPSAVTQRDVQSIEVRTIDAERPRVVAVHARVVIAPARRIATTRLFVTHRALLL
jgi:hypothetical protein